MPVTSVEELIYKNLKIKPIDFITMSHMLHVSIVMGIEAHVNKP